MLPALSKRGASVRHDIEHGSVLAIRTRTVMNYTLLIYENSAGFALRSDKEKAAAYGAGFYAYSKALRDAGVFIAGAGLQVPTTATTLRVGDDKRKVQDGAYAETKEQLGGYYVINVADLDAALEWAARIPAAAGSFIEVRPNLVPPGA
jgi:hypothetical protein